MIGRVLIVAALVFLGWSGWSWFQPADGPEQQLGDSRELVLSQGSRQIATLNTMDHATVEAGLKSWRDAATGPLLAQLGRDEADNRKLVATGKTTAVGTVTEAAVLSLDDRAGRAVLIASVKIDLTAPNTPPSDQRKRYEAGLERTADGWKLSSLSMIPVDGR
ncbi:hypothetical protein GCM10027589_07590 [Actinocorallia lasiicapitis]